MKPDKKERSKILKDSRPEIREILNNFANKYDNESEIDLIKSPNKPINDFSFVIDMKIIKKLLRRYTTEEPFSIGFMPSMQKRIGEINKFYQNKPRYDEYIKINKLIKQASNKRELNKIRTKLNNPNFYEKFSTYDLGEYKNILYDEIEKKKQELPKKSNKN